jgi:hypothetical protein
MIFILLSLTINLWAVEFENVTGEEAEKARNAIINAEEMDGVRIAFDDMKTKNKKYGTGKVDKKVNEYQKNLINEMKEFETRNPGVKIKIVKTDFKGYYVTCTPTEKCDYKKVLEKASYTPTVSFRDGRKVDKFEIKAVTATNFKEGYIKGKAIGSYPDEFTDSTNLSEFIQKKMKEAMATANTQDPDFDKKLGEQIGHYRAGDLDKVDPTNRPLIQALDDLLEIPFANSNDLENELEEAINQTSKDRKIEGTPYTLSQAKSGDDLFLIIKDDNNNVLKVIGADARGLGVVNMETRLEAYKRGLAGANGKPLSMTEILALSKSAGDKADDIMEKSMKAYEDVIARTLKEGGKGALDDVLANAHHAYVEETHKEPKVVNGVKEPKLMMMRSAAIPKCVTAEAVKCVQDRITIIHNALKEMEKQGFPGYFGDSCLGAMYWLNKSKYGL